jgi:hypothetical protein
MRVLAAFCLSLSPSLPPSLIESLPPSLPPNHPPTHPLSRIHSLSLPPSLPPSLSLSLSLAVSLCSPRAAPRTVNAGGSTWSQGGVVAGTVPEPPPPRSVAGASAAATQNGESLEVKDWEKLEHVNDNRRVSVRQDKRWRAADACHATSTAPGARRPRPRGQVLTRENSLTPVCWGGMFVQAREHAQQQAHAYTEEERRLALELKEKRRMLAAKQQLSTQPVPMSSVGAPLVTNVTMRPSISFRTSYPSAMPEFSKVSTPLSPPAGSSPQGVNAWSALNAAPDYGLAPAGDDEGGREGGRGGREGAAAAAGREYEASAEGEYWRAAPMPGSHAHEVMRPMPPLGGGAASAGSSASPRPMGARSPIGVPLPPPRPVQAFPEDRGDEDPILHPITGDPILRQVMRRRRQLERERARERERERERGDYVYMHKCLC